MKTRENNRLWFDCLNKAESLLERTLIYTDMNKVRKGLLAGDRINISVWTEISKGVIGESKIYLKGVK